MAARKKAAAKSSGKASEKPIARGVFSEAGTDYAAGDDLSKLDDRTLRRLKARGLVTTEAEQAEKAERGVGTFAAPPAPRRVPAPARTPRTAPARKAPARKAPAKRAAKRSR